jgi:hypothetical protein
VQAARAYIEIIAYGNFLWDAGRGRQNAIFAARPPMNPATPLIQTAKNGSKINKIPLDSIPYPDRIQKKIILL